MDKEEFPESSNKNSQKANGLREVLESVRTILVAPIALLISIAEWIGKSFRNLQLKTEKQAKVDAERREEENARKEKEQKAEERSIREDQRKAAEQSKIAEEKRAEERTIREEERKAKERSKLENKLNIKKVIYPSLSAISTIALIVGVVRLGPIAQWTKSQNECIESSTPETKENSLNLSNKVMRCNGGHE